jgi:hypothetical protein
MRKGAHPVTGIPAMWTLPERGGTSPSIERISVVLPIPFRPMSATASPSATEKSTPCRMWLLP